MILFRDLDDVPDSFCHGAVAIGKFDGVHCGHARILRRLLAMARRVGGPALVFTFDPLPEQILRPEHAGAPLVWIERKAELLGEMGADAVLAHPTDEAFLGLEARTFFDEVLRRRLDARAIVEGPTFTFGHNRMGTVRRLREFCAEADISLEVVDRVMLDGQVVSSSRIRALLAAGRVGEAQAMLSRPHRLRGTVVRGAGRGATLGYPTANVGYSDVLIPGEGIYAGRAWTGGISWSAAISVGPNPTFDEGGLKVEVHLLGFQGDLYGQILEVDFLARLRDIERFGSLRELVAQIERDVAATRQIVEQCTTPKP